VAPDPADRPGSGGSARARSLPTARPVVTLYHWDLPQTLEDAGGWAARDTAERFADYAEIVHRALGDGVPLWITLNEPWVSAWLGYGAGVHAPGETDDGLAMAATHHLLLAHGLARDAMGADPSVGISLNLQPTRAASDEPSDVLAAHLTELHANALFLDPLFGRGYPAELLDRYGSVSDLRFIRDGDLAILGRPPDFLGLNFYRPLTVTGRPRSEHRAELPGHLGAWTVVPPGADVTAMGWPIEPEGLSEVLIRLHREYGPTRMFVTENGAAFDDEVDASGGVADPARIAYLGEHLGAASDAIRAGVPLEGFFVWSLLDNFEWAEGYSKRFGLVHVDFETQRRTPKQSAWWYRDVVRSEGSALP
jgi:beta-glucosidase